jgi:hypothetical protein
LAATPAADEDGPAKIVGKDADAAHIARLVEQLGSDSFAEREAASRDLERIGAAALEALRKAARSSDIETRRRAEALVKKIGKEVASREVLQAKQVHLRFKDTPLSEAVAELAKQSGYDVALDDPNSKLKERTVTLDTGEVPFWKAVDLLCRAAGLVEAVADDPQGMPMFRGGGGIGLPGGPGGALPAMPLLPGAPGQPGGGALPKLLGPGLPGGGAKAPHSGLPGGAAGGAAAKPKPAEKGAIPPPTSAGPTAPLPGGQVAPPKEAPAQKKAPAPAPAIPGPTDAKLGLIPAGPAAGGQAAAPPPGTKVVAPPAAPGPGGLPAGPVLKAPPAAGGTNAPPAANRLVLREGKADTSPTAYIGAARIRAVSDPKIMPAPPARDGESSVHLEFSLEPKLVWRRCTALRLDKAVDDQGQTLTEAAADNTPTPGVGGAKGPGGPGGAIALLPAYCDLGFCTGTNLYTSLCLKKGDKLAKTIKELKGTLTAEVFGPSKPIITVDNLIQAAGKTIKGKDGGSLEVLEVVKDGDDVTVKLTLDPPSDLAIGGTMTAGMLAVPPALPAPGGVLPVPGPAAKLLPPPAPAVGAIVLGVPVNSQDAGISLTDGNGKSVQTTRYNVSYRAGDKGLSTMHEFTFRLPKDQKVIKLVFSGRLGRRSVLTIDVPFTLKNVPLP